MASKQNLSFLKNLARGGVSYRTSRHRIALHLERMGPSASTKLSPFLQNRLFSLDRNRWVALAFDHHDWRTLKTLQRTESRSVHENYLKLAISHITTNALRVLNLYDCNSSISNAVLQDDGNQIVDLINNLDPIDQESLMALRTMCAVDWSSGEELRDNIKQRTRSAWVSGKFAYPLINHAITAPSDEHLDTLLSYVLSGDEEAVERRVIRFLLRDDFCFTESLGFKAYVALLCHPYDACEIVLNHIELEYARDGFLSSELSATLQEISESIPTARVECLKDLIFAPAIIPVDEPECLPLSERYGFDTVFRDFTEQFIRTKTNYENCQDDAPEILKKLARMRRERYPLVEDYNFLAAIARQWRFCELGRVLNSLLVSLFLLPRREPQLETRDLLRLQTYLGDPCSFIVTSPSGDRLVRLFQEKVWQSTQGQILIENAVEAAGTYKDRMWIKAVHWELRSAEKNLRIDDWLKSVHREIRVAPAFLTGVDWTWLDQIIRKMRIDPFEKNIAGPYVLLLMLIEEPHRDPTILRAAIASFLPTRDIAKAVSWLIEQYKDEAIAFVRYFLTVNNILMLQLAPNEMAALAGRIYALETCVRTHGFSGLISPEIFERESKALAAALQLRRLNAGQFEIPWNIFALDELQKRGDLFEAAQILAPADKSPSPLGGNRVTNSHRYGNGKVVEYAMTATKWPIVNLIISVIDDFIEHPSFGLEVLLSTRFRHDTLKRELVKVTSEVEQQGISSVTSRTRTVLLERFSFTLSPDVEGWLGNRMQSKRPDHPDGLFDLIPDQNSMADMVAQLSAVDNFALLVEGVSDWIRERLQIQIVAARGAFERELLEILTDSTDKVRDSLLSEHKARPADVEKVSTAWRTAIQRRVNELAEWFNEPEESSRGPLTFYEVETAVEGLFEQALNRKEFRIDLPVGHSMNRDVEADRVRLCFDLLGEVFENALSHGLDGRTKLRVREYEADGTIGFIFSNLAPEQPPYIDRVRGQQYTSATDAIFREGNSGLAKIASLAATLVSNDCDVTIERKRNSFHLIVPIWKGEES